MANVSNIPVWRDIGCSPCDGNGTTEDARVVIVGAGPVGLALALDLGRRGHDVLVINKRDFIAAGSKAICFSKRTLDILDRLGVGDWIVEKGVVWNVGKVFWGQDEVPIYQFDMLLIKDQKRPGFVNIQQYHVEEHLWNAIRKLPNITVRWGHEVIGVEDHDRGTRITVAALDGSYHIRAEWLIACDGSRSSVRDLLGLDFQGRVFEDNFLIADIKMNGYRPAERWFWFDPPFNPGQSALLHKQPDDVWRLDFQLGWNIDRAGCVRAENVETYIRAMLGPDVAFSQEWYSVYTFQCRRMERFVHGHVIFAGDSAHLVSPFGARGCNGGIADTDNLAWKLDLVIQEQAPASLLESYNHEAVITAEENIRCSSRSTDFMTPKTEVSRAFRDAVLELAKEHPFARPFVNSGRLSTPVSYPNSPLNTVDTDAWSGGVAPGSPAVDCPLGSQWLLEMLGNSFVLLANEWNEPVPRSVLALDVSRYRDSNSLLLKRYELTRGAAYLIRPDQYVAARWQQPTRELVEAALARAIGRA